MVGCQTLGSIHTPPYIQMPLIHLDVTIYVDTPICLDVPPYVWTPPIHLDAPIYLDTPICSDAPIFGCPLYDKMPPYVLDTPHMFRCPPLCLNVPNTSVCLHAPLYSCMFLGGIYIFYGDGSIYTPYIECSDAITRVTYKMHYKSVHVGKYKFK